MECSISQILENINIRKIPKVSRFCVNNKIYFKGRNFREQKLSRILALFAKIYVAKFSEPSHSRKFLFAKFSYKCHSRKFMFAKFLLIRSLRFANAKYIVKFWYILVKLSLLFFDFSLQD